MASLRWIVAAADAGLPVAEVVARMGETARGALAEGRVFASGVRARGEERVVAGDVIEVWGARAPRTGGGAVSPTLPLVLARQSEVIFAAKPADLATEPDRRGGDALTSRLARELGVPQVHAASRLDAGVSGVVACSCGPRGARRLALCKERGLLRRAYLAIASGELAGEGSWETPIDGRSACSRWRVLAVARGATALEIELVTGRTHQIRRHAAGAGAPLLGDRLHGSPRRVTSASGAVLEVLRPMLHAAAAALLDRTDQRPFAALAQFPDDMLAVWTALDGAASAWEEWRPPWEVEPRAPVPSSAASPRSPSASPRRRSRS